MTETWLIIASIATLAALLWAWYLTATLPIPRVFQAEMKARESRNFGLRSASGSQIHQPDE